MASRSKRFLLGLLAGYGSILANVLYVLVSMPLAFKYLDKDRLGLWVQSTQINGYLLLVDLGIGDAISRFIADYKDDVNGGEYGRHLITGSIVFLVQGIAVIFLGAVVAFVAPSAYSISSDLVHDFRILLIAVTSTTGISIMFKGIGSPLWCFQRNDVIYACSSLGFLLNLALLWLALKNNLGLVSLALAQVPTLIITILIYFLVCKRNRYYPNVSALGRPSIKIFKKVSSYGRDVLFVSLGTQLVSATPVMVIGRFISLQESTNYAVATKFFAMAMQMVTLPITTASPALTELFVRRNFDKFKDRYLEVILYVLSLSIVVAVGVAVGNSVMLSMWIKQVTWAGSCDLVLALYLILRNISGCYVGLFGVAKNWKPVKFLYFIEGVVLAGISITASKLIPGYGLLSILVTQLLVHVVITVGFSSYKSSLLLGSPSPILSKVVMGMLYVGIMGWLSNFKYISSADLSLKLLWVVVSSVGACFFVWFFILSNLMRREIWQRVFRQNGQI